MHLLELAAKALCPVAILPAKGDPMESLKEVCTYKTRYFLVTTTICITSVSIAECYRRLCEICWPRQPSIIRSQHIIKVPCRIKISVRLERRLCFFTL